MKHKILRLFLAFSILCALYSVVYAEEMNLIYDGKTHSYSGKPIHLYIDGQEIVTTVMPPIQINGSVLVPAREVFGVMGAEVEWRPSEQSVYVHDENNLIVLTINSEEAWVNSETKMLHTPAKLINDKVMIPIRFISESLGYSVLWSPNESAVYITTQQVLPSEPNIGTDNVENSPIEEDKNIENELPSDWNTSDGNSDMTTDINDDIVQPDLIESTQFISAYADYDMLDYAVVLSGIDGLNASAITYEENIRTKQIVIRINGDYNNYLPSSLVMPQDGVVKEIRVLSEMGQTQIIIQTEVIRELMVEEQEGVIRLKIVKPSEKYSKIVVIDAGHGDHDAGTSYNGIKEKDINLALSQQLVTLLEADPSIKVYATRSDDTFLELMERVEFSNQIEPDLFISIHVNSVNGNTAAAGTETYYTEDPDTRNKVFATMVQEALVNEFGTKNRGVKSNTFVVTRYTDAPAILIEIGFLTNDGDRAMMTSPGFEERYAQAVYQCILNYYDQGLDY